MNNSKIYMSAVIFLSFALTSCSGMRARDAVRSGVLQRELPQQAFLDVWGAPDRTSTYTPEPEEKRLEFGPFRGFYGRSGTTYEVWEYSKRGVVLFFDDTELSEWKTEKTTGELSAPSR